MGTLDLGVSSHTPESAMTLNEELIKLRQQVKELDKENRRRTVIGIQDTLAIYTGLNHSGLDMKAIGLPPKDMQMLRLGSQPSMTSGWDGTGAFCSIVCK